MSSLIVYLLIHVFWQETMVNVEKTCWQPEGVMLVWLS